MKGKKEGINLNDIANEAIDKGIEKIADSSFFSENFLKGYIDNTSLKRYIQEEASNLKGYSNKTELKESLDKFYDNIVEGVTSGRLFKEKGKEIILNKSLEGEANSNFLKGYRARRLLKKQTEFSKSIKVIKDLYSLFKENPEYIQGNSKVYNLVEKVSKSTFENAALEILRGHGLITPSEYSKLKSKSMKGVNEAMKKTKGYLSSSIEDYLSNEKIAASIIIISGFGFLSVSKNITGNVIGVGNVNILFSLIGFLLIIVGVGFGFRKKFFNKSKR